MITPTVWSERDAQEITQLLHQAYGGNKGAMDDVFTLVYRELKAIASRQRRKSRKGAQTLNTTALVHEAWIRLRDAGIEYESRRHFLAIAARVMHQILVDQARRNLGQKRGGDRIRISLRPDMGAQSESQWMLDLDRALATLADRSPRLRDLFQLRYFLGLTEVEAADVLEVSDRTVQRDWIKVRAFMSASMGLAPGQETAG